MMILQSKTRKSRSQLDKVKIVLILTIIYIIMYVLTGLKVGYEKSPYSLKIVEIIKNIFTVFAIPIIYEFIRTKLIERTQKWFGFIFISLVFFAIQIDYEKIYSIISKVDLIEYVLEILLNMLIESFLLSYLSKNGGLLLNLAYTIPIQLSFILLPIFPNLDWFTYISLRFILYVLIYIFIKHEDSIRIKKKPRRQIRRENPIRSIPAILFIILIVSFVAGFLPYKPVAVISNSMVPFFKRGDVCIIKKVIDYSEIREIDEGDVIEYQLNDRYILHRVTEVIQMNNGFSYYTKGDNNVQQDLLRVEEEQIVGKVIYVIPYLGYPSVWFSEWLLNKK